jgi:hypothetical protein
MCTDQDRAEAIANPRVGDVWALSIDGEWTRTVLCVDEQCITFRAHYDGEDYTCTQARESWIDVMEHATLLRRGA